MSSERNKRIQRLLHVQKQRTKIEEFKALKLQKQQQSLAQDTERFLEAMADLENPFTSAFSRRLAEISVEKIVLSEEQTQQSKKVLTQNMTLKVIEKIFSTLEKQENDQKSKKNLQDMIDHVILPKNFLRKR